ncbi:MAG: PHP domain-containing protein [Leptolyngbya sp. PLA1]|nr:PHP domain-containing protein [Leptolyngbya sp. PLA1]
MSLNQPLADILARMAKMLDVLGEDAFKVNAHTRAARTFEGLADDVGTMSREQLLALQGVGPKLADKAIEFRTTGRIAEHDELATRVPAGVMDMMELPGVGPKTARVLWQEGAISDIPSLERAIADGSILTLPRMGEKSVAKIKESIAFRRANSQRLWLGRAHDVADVFIERLKAHHAVADAVAAGSLRRGRDTIGDLDILACLRESHLSDAAGVVECFRATPGVSSVLASGENKCSVRVSLAHDFGRWSRTHTAEGDGPSIQVDLRVTPPATWGATLLYFTGSKEHNIRLRERAIARGMTLSEWGLFAADGIESPPHTRGCTPIAAATEEDIYRALGLPFIPPEAREDRGEFEHLGPWRLIDLADIRAELHAHTKASDGSLTILELAEDAKRRGFHTIAVTDHSQSSAQAGGLKPDRLREHIAAVREANRHITGITILAGSEVDILSDGSLDYDDDLLRELDVVVASPHAALSQDPATATARLLRAIAHPLVHILGHPTGRLINRRPGLSPDIPALVAAARAHNVALEINAHWMRLDLRDTHTRAAIDAGCLIAIDCDVHEPSDFDNLAFGVTTARRGWVTPERCLNAWPADRLHDWLRSKGRG